MAAGLLSSTREHPLALALVAVDAAPEWFELEGLEIAHIALRTPCVPAVVEREPDLVAVVVGSPAQAIPVVRELRDDGRTDTLPVVVVSRDSGAEERARLLQEGAWDHIDVALDAGERAARIHAALRLGARLRTLARQRYHDQLTGLPDRAAFLQRVREEASRALRTHAPLSLLLCDVDGMRRFNATAGRMAGDDALRTVADTIRSTLRSSDAVFRVGGDEFAALLPDTDLPTARRAADRVRDALALADTDHAVTLSIGIADFAPGKSTDDTLRLAELALSRARGSGGNQTWRSDDPRRHALNTRSLSEELTDREWAVLAHLARRRSEQEIAHRLGIRAGTVRSHKARIRRKLHVPPNTRLADFARANFAELVAELGLTDPAAQDDAPR